MPRDVSPTQIENETGATLILSAEGICSLSVKSLNLTPKGFGANSDLQTDGDVQRRDISHLDGRELQVRMCEELYCIVLCCIILYCIVLCCSVLYYIVLYCIVLYCIVLYCIVLPFIALYLFNFDSDT